ncbi:MAG: GFA family protein [Alphaproteobacteria bacterium]|nr:GFA family protein [Alphaproteobacteria bacterium]MBU2418210.1 GFA family protein [Alphaproteobacteria bacterium]
MTRTGGCNCGEVRYELEGEPLRVGLCHCETCRKFTGSAFSHYGVWPQDRVRISGETRCWQVRAGGDRFCPTCGASLFTWNEDEDEVEVKLGTLDDPPVGLRPAYELWTIRRERWLGPLEGSGQWERDRQD